MIVSFIVLIQRRKNSKEKPGSSRNCQNCGGFQVSSPISYMYYISERLSYNKGLCICKDNCMILEDCKAFFFVIYMFIQKKIFFNHSKVYERKALTQCICSFIKWKTFLRCSCYHNFYYHKWKYPHCISIPTMLLWFYRTYIKEEKTVQEGISRMSCKPMYKVQEDVASLKQLLSIVSNGLQRNACAVEKLKKEMTQVRG